MSLRRLKTNVDQEWRKDLIVSQSSKGTWWPFEVQRNLVIALRSLKLEALTLLLSQHTQSSTEQRKEKSICAAEKKKKADAGRKNGWSRRWAEEHQQSSLDKLRFSSCFVPAEDNSRLLSSTCRCLYSSECRYAGFCFQLYIRVYEDGSSFRSSWSFGTVVLMVGRERSVPLFHWVDFLCFPGWFFLF